MSTEKMREEFEVAYLEEINEDGDSVSMNDIKNSRVDDTYSVPIMAGAWWAWQASRAALVIDLVEVDISAEFISDYAKGYRQAKRDSKDAIEAAGVKWK